MNAKIIAFSLALIAMVAGCTSVQNDSETDMTNQQVIDSGNQAIDNLFTDYGENVTDIDLGEMI